jgi:hypothetical protein
VPLDAAGGHVGAGGCAVTRGRLGRALLAQAADLLTVLAAGFIVGWALILLVSP